MNRLANEISPYLLQHADNPVSWQPWDQEALAQAAAEGKPILLSIGYAACHWCHVMAHESFEDERTAEVMNRLFVNIKVDKEERPDLDRIYQLAHQVIAQRTGGWPLTCFIDPDTGVPFFAGTYFPKTPRYGMPAFIEVLEGVSAYFCENRGEIEVQGAQLVDFLKGRELAPAGKVVDAAPLDMVRNQLFHEFDPEAGGFGGAPKFPQPGRVERLLRHWALSRRRGEEDEQALHMAVFSLCRMADSGLFDHLGGGFFRYCVDANWEVPHFEKMLYDNAQLLPLYAQAWAVTGDDVLRQTARQTADWLISGMQGPGGGFYASVDADSPDGEGAYYVWNQAELKAILGPEYAGFAGAYGLDRVANFEGRWHLQHYRETEPVSEARYEMSPGSRALLLASRDRRTSPGLDDKILPSWNGLTVRGLAIATRHGLGQDCAAAGARAIGEIRRYMWRQEGLAAVKRGTETRLEAYLDDYVYLIDAIIELIQIRWDADLLGFARALAQVVMERFRDEERGGFFFTPHEHEPLMIRSRPFADDAMPSGNGIAARALGRLGHLIGDTSMINAAHETLQAAWQSLNDAPYGHDALLSALEEQLFPPRQVIIRGVPPELDQWHRAALSPFDPACMVFAIPDELPLPPGMGDFSGSPSGPVAYCCAAGRCVPPIHSLDDFLSWLGGQV